MLHSILALVSPWFPSEHAAGIRFTRINQSVLLFLRRGWLVWTFRLAGWLLMLPCTAVLADELNPSLLPAPITGSKIRIVNR